MKRTIINSIISRAAMTLLLGVFTLTAQAQNYIYEGYTALEGTEGAKDSEKCDMLLDGSRDTKWCVKNQTSCYIVFESNDPIAPTGYILTTANDTKDNPGRNPKSWVIKAKRTLDDYSWTELVSVTNSSTPGAEDKTDYNFTISNANGTLYKYFLFQVTEFNSGTTFQLSEFRFLCNRREIDFTSLGSVSFMARNGDVLTGAANGSSVISIDNNATVTLRDFGIYVGQTCNNAGITCIGNATIILEGNNTVTNSNRFNPGIAVGGSKTTLTITGSGSLTASNNVDYGMGAGIGTGNNATCGDIVIEGGTITATGGTFASGIGSGQSSECGDIFIRGGTVTANGGKDGAGIGTGSDGTCERISISGGNITAIGGKYAAGIGNASTGNCGRITITNNVARVSATKGDSSPYSIGAGSSDSDKSTCGTITIGDIVTGSISQSPFITYPYMVAFKANGGTGTMSDKVMMYSVPQNLPNNTYKRTNYAFAGWTTEANGTGTTYSNQQSVSFSENTTLYAQWQRGELADGTAYYVVQDGAVNSATYTKTLGSERVGKHQAWMVPFDYTITTDDVEKFTFYKINMIANSPDPSVEVSNEVWVFLKKLNAGEVLHANMPYVYKPKVAVTDYQFTSNNATLKAKNTDVLAKAETLEDVYSFYGIYENTTPAASDPFYYVGIDGNLSLGNNGTVTVGPYRWILRKTSKYGGTSAYARNMHFFDPEEDETGISDAERLNDKVQMINDSWFSLDGRKLDGQPTRKGLFIHNGRKVVVE